MATVRYEGEVGEVREAEDRDDDAMWGVRVCPDWLVRMMPVESTVIIYRRIRDKSAII